MVKSLKKRDQVAKDTVDFLGISYRALIDEKNWHGKRGIPMFASMAAYA